jgi:hypothetical protein
MTDTPRHSEDHPHEWAVFIEDVPTLLALDMTNEDPELFSQGESQSTTLASEVKTRTAPNLIQTVEDEISKTSPIVSSATAATVADHTALVERAQRVGALQEATDDQASAAKEPSVTAETRHADSVTTASAESALWLEDEGIAQNPASTNEQSANLSSLFLSFTLSGCCKPDKDEDDYE